MSEPVKGSKVTFMFNGVEIAGFVDEPFELAEEVPPRHMMTKSLPKSGSISITLLAESAFPFGYRIEGDRWHDEEECRFRAVAGYRRAHPEPVPADAWDEENVRLHYDWNAGAQVAQDRALAARDRRIARDGARAINAYRARKRVQRFVEAA